MPIVSIIMAAYNCDRFISEAIASVQSQTFTDWELIVVDDGSTDRTGSIAEEAAFADTRIRIIRQKNSGRPSITRNIGLEVARGEFVSFLDADDFYSEDRLDTCVAKLRENIDCGIVFHDFSTVAGDASVIRPSVLSELRFIKSEKIQFESIETNLLRLNDGLHDFLMTDYVACWTGAVMLRATAFDKDLLRFREDVVIAEDLDLWLRVLRKSPALFINRPLASYRKHEGSITSLSSRFLKDTIHVIEIHRKTVEEQSDRNVAAQVTERLRTLHAELGYLYLRKGDSRMARKWYARGLICYKGSANIIGFMKSCLPWAAMRVLLGRADNDRAADLVMTRTNKSSRGEVKRPEFGVNNNGLLFVVPWELHHAGGVNIVVKALIKEINYRGDIRPCVMVIDWSAKEQKYYSSVDGRWQVAFRLQAPGIGKVKTFASFTIGLPGRLLRLRRLLRELHIEAVNVHYPGLWAINFLILRWLWPKAPRVILSFHGTDLIEAQSCVRAEYRLWRWMLLRANGVTACSRCLANQVEKEFQLPKRKVRAIHNGVDCEKMNHDLIYSQSIPEMSDGRRWILNIANYEYKKGQDVLLEAFSILSKEIDNIALMYVGRKGDSYTELTTRAKELGLGNRIAFRFDIPHSEIPNYLRAAEIFALPSRSEPFGIVVVEAGFAGLPVVASRVGGVPEIINSARHGLLVEPGNVTDLSNALRQLLNDPEHGRRLGMALRSHVSERFTWSMTSDGYLSVIKAGSVDHEVVKQ